MTLLTTLLPLMAATTSVASADSAAALPIPAHAVFAEGLHAHIHPQGWLREILVRQNQGLTGHPEAMSYPFDSSLWVGDLKRDSENRGSDWWRYEQTAYYLDGLTRLGFLLDDPQLLAVAKENVDWILNHPLPAKKGVPYTEADIEAAMRRGPGFNAEVTADPKALAHMQRRREHVERQLKIASIDRPEGRLGVDISSMAWPFAVVFRALKAYYEATGDQRIPAALEKNYLSYTSDELGWNRFLVNVEGILWTYSITGNPALLNLAEEAWKQNASELTQENCLDDSEYHMHGVTMTELLKVPMLLYAHTGKEEYRLAAIKADEKMERANMLADGVNSSSEALAGNDPLASHETCDISDYTWSMGYYLTSTGDTRWADRIEKAIFNAGLGAITKDFRSMQYFSCPNQVIATGNSNHNEFKQGLTWMAYRPIHETECCIGNLHRYLPNYAARMWMTDAKGHPVAALYGPSSVDITLPDGTAVNIEETTAYPFGETVDFTFRFTRDGHEVDSPVDMDFTYRIPEWCTATESGFHTVSRAWNSGDTFSVALPMEVKVVDNPVAGRTIERGPILYSLAVSADVTEDTEVYENLAGKTSGNPDFKSWNMTPAGKWNYALTVAGPDDIKVETRTVDGFPFDPGNSPVRLKVPAVGVKGWTLVDGRYTPALPETVEAEEGTATELELVPYGSTTLRLTTFPVQE